MIKPTKDVSFFEVQPMFICEQSSLKIMDVNEVASDLLEYSRKQIINKRILDLGKRKSSKELNLELSTKSHISSDDIWLFKTKAGEHLYFQLSGHLINYKGNPAKLVIAHNVTEIVLEGTSEKVISSQLNLNNFPLAEIEWDLQLNIIHWSEKAEMLFGYTSEEADETDELLKKFIHKDDLDYVRNKIRQAHKKGEQEVSVINRNITKDGEVIYCEWYNSLLYNAEGEVVSVYSLTHDVTDREKALSDTKRSMMSYQDLFNSISDAIYLLNKDGVIIEANKGLESTFGYKRSEIIGEHNKILSAPGKYDEERVQEIIEKAEDGEPGKYEGWGKKKNGEVFPTEFLVNTGNYFSEDVLIVIERDITEQKQSEEALKQREGLLSKLFNSSPIGIALLNEHHEVEMVNDGFEQLFGYRESELKGLELDKLIVPEQDHQEALRLTESARVKEATEKRIRKDGTIIDVIIYAVPVVVEKSIVGIYGLYVDITDRKEAEEQVRKSLKEKEMLLAEIHHRVKNNLAVITGLLELQSYSAESESAKRILNDSQMRVQSIAMVHEKLYKSDDFSEIDIKKYFEELSRVIGRTMKKSDVEVSTDVDIASVKLPITQAIPCGLLLNEILSNSYKHAFEGRDNGKIYVHLEECKSEGEICLKISDDGVGLPEFSDLDLDKSLGITLIKTLANQLNAEFDFRNEGGAVFEFWFKKKDRSGELDSSLLKT